MLMDCIRIKQVGDQIATNGVRLTAEYSMLAAKLRPGEAIAVTDLIRDKAEKLVRQGLCEIVKMEPNRPLYYSDAREASTANPKNVSAKDDRFRAQVKKNLLDNFDEVEAMNQKRARRFMTDRKLQVQIRQQQREAEAQKRALERQRATQRAAPEAVK